MWTGRATFSCHTDFALLAGDAALPTVCDIGLQILACVVAGGLTRGAGRTLPSGADLCSCTRCATRSTVGAVRLQRCTVVATACLADRAVFALPRLTGLCRCTNFSTNSATGSVFLQVVTLRSTGFLPAGAAHTATVGAKLRAGAGIVANTTVGAVGVGQHAVAVAVG